MPDFPIIDAHVHLTNPKQLGYAWTKNAPSLNRQVLPDDLMKAAAPVQIDRFVFVEVDVDFPQHVAEGQWVESLAERDPRLAGMVAALPLERGKGAEPELDQLCRLKHLRGIRRLIQNQADPETLTTTEGLYSELSNWAAPAMYVSHMKLRSDLVGGPE